MKSIDYVLKVARLSECTRRKYGAIIWSDYWGLVLTHGYNKRVGTCCNGTCIRDELKLGHGENTDAGAEIHAEQALLVNHRPSSRGTEDLRLYIAGIGPDGTPYNGFENRPCYSCARMIKYAGFNQVYLPFDREWEAISIDDIMENWEKSWT